MEPTQNNLNIAVKKDGSLTVAQCSCETLNLMQVDKSKCPIHKPKHAGGRPSEYSEEILQKAIDYINSCNDVDEDRENKITKSVNIPTIEGLAYEIKVNKTTIYEWEKTYPRFSNVIDDLRAKQARQLVNKGLSGAYNPTIAKVLLTKHGYREGVDNTSNGNTINSNVIVFSDFNGDEEKI